MSFIISGIVGSIISAFIFFVGTLASIGGIWSPVYIWLPAGLLGGLSGYGIFKRLKSYSSKLLEGLLIVFSAILGFVFWVLLMMLWDFIYYL